MLPDWERKVLVPFLHGGKGSSSEVIIGCKGLYSFTSPAPLWKYHI
jgi:hypothetical protein